MDIDFLYKICDLESEIRIKQAPFNFELDGKRYVVATNGHMLAAVESDAEAATVGNKYIPYLEDIFKFAYARSYTIDVNDLRKFCGQPNFPADCKECGGEQTFRVKCENCDGTGKVEHECDTCLHTHECVCTECEDGFIEKECPACQVDFKQVITLDGANVSREYMARLLSGITEPTATLRVNGPEDHIRIDGNGWFVVLMPILRVVPSVVTREYPLKQEATC